jgi:hypothetical protein
MLHALVIATLRIIRDCDIREQSRSRRNGYSVASKKLRTSLRGFSCCVSDLRVANNAGLRAWAHPGRAGICLGPLNGKTGELPADHGLGSSGRGTGTGRSRGQLAPLLDASRQSVILLRTHSS